MSNWLRHTNLNQRLSDYKHIGTSGNELIFGADFTWSATIAAGLNPQISIQTDNPLSVVDTHAFMCHEVRVSGQFALAAGVAASPSTTFLAWGCPTLLQWNVKADGRKREIFDAFKPFDNCIGPDGGLRPQEFHMKFNAGEKLALKLQINGSWIASTVPLLISITMTGEYVERKYA